jgi:methyl-accepting chemotaxis protein
MPSIRQSALLLAVLCALQVIAVGALLLLPAGSVLHQPILIAALAMAAGGFAIGGWNAVRVTKERAATLHTARAIAGGQLDSCRNSPAFDTAGEMQSTLQDIATREAQFVRTTGKHAAELAGEAASLAGTSAELVRSSSQTNNKAISVASASEQMSASLAQMSESTNTLSMNFRTVAAAVEEMTASIADVAKNTERSASVAKEAEELAQRSNQSITELDSAAEEIGKVIQVIEDIAEQTNLLALNATIEAARAGEAGRGFAVVASEVKELARQTAEATSDIQRRIAHIQAASREAVTNMGHIGKAITQVNGTARSIAAAVDQQSIATKEIAANVAQSASSSNVVSDGVAQCAQASHEIAQSIADVSGEAQRNARTAGRLEGASANLGQLGAALVEAVRSFSKRTDGFDLLGFQAGHIGWKKRLAEVLAGKTTITERDVSDHHQCALGKWYDTDGKARWGHLTAFRTLHDEHAEFHRLARAIAAAVVKQDLQTAHDDYEKLSDLSVTVVNRLRQLEDEAANSADLVTAR